MRAGREDLLAYTDFIPLPWGISPLRSGQNPHSGRNDIIKPNERLSDNATTFDRNDVIKPNEHNVISSASNVVIVINRIKPNFHVVIRGRQSRNPLHKKRHATHPRQPTCPQGLPAVHDHPKILARGSSPPPLLSFRFREIPTVVSLPRNDKLYTRVRHFSRIIIINKAYARTDLSLRAKA